VVMDFALIPAGVFRMGSEPNSLGRRSDESPRQRVTLSRPLYVATTEVTQAQYRRLMRRNPSEVKGGLYPVNAVTWADATLFCRRLTRRERNAQRLREGERYRLPTEAEWEYACRAGTTGRFSFGSVDDDLPHYGWYLANAEDQPHVVASKKPSPWGLYDMHGNVWEWCLDWYAPHYPGGQPVDPTGPTRGSSHTARGGSWMDPASRCRSAARFSAPPKFRSPMLGFRVVRTIVEQKQNPPPGGTTETENGNSQGDR